MPEPCLPPLDMHATRTIAPTDVARFVRLQQCERFLRFRLHERTLGTGFMADYGVQAQQIPLLFPRSGLEFEDQIEAEAAAAFPSRSFRQPAHERGTWTDDNAAVLAQASTLAAGETTLLFQPRLQADVNGWRMRGAVDVLRMRRDDEGRLSILIADMKATRATKIEHRLQVAFYQVMISAIFAEANQPLAGIEIAILFRGSLSPDPALTDEERAELERQRQEAADQLGTSVGYLEIVRDPQHYVDAVEDLVTGEHSTARRVAAQPFEDVPFHIGRHCDGCIFNEYCMKWSHEHDDLSGIPHLTMTDKTALQQIGLRTVADLAALKQPKSPADFTLVAAPGQELLAEVAATTWPVGPRIDELVLRARSYRSRMRHDGEKPPSYIPDKGYGTLPASTPEQHPNLVRVYIDAQEDYLHNRVYMLGALIVGAENGKESAERRRTIVRLADSPPDTEAAEQHLLVDWISEVLKGVIDVAAPDADGEPRAPVHLIFWEPLTQKLLLDALARHFRTIVEATPLYDFMTQMASFDSALGSFLSEEIRQHRNYPFVCQSLQSVAAWLGFNWNEPEEYRKLFAGRLFDFWGKFDSEDNTSWYMARSRFNSQIPLEYAYGAWDELPDVAETREYRRFGAITTANLAGFERRRLEALEHITHNLPTNQDTTKTAYLLPDLHLLDGKSHSLASALKEFVLIERFVELSAWRAARSPAPEKRVLSGETLLVRYFDDDQSADVRIANEENRRRLPLREKAWADATAATPPGEKVELAKEIKNSVKPIALESPVRLRLDIADTDCGLEETLLLTNLRSDAPILINPRTEIDSRPGFNNREYTPTAKSMLYALRGSLIGLSVDRDGDGKPRRAWANVDLRSFGGRGADQFIFSTMPGKNQPFDDGRLYMLDGDPNDWTGSHSLKLAETLEGEGDKHTLYRWLDGNLPESTAWPEAARVGQQRFVAGLQALYEADLLNDFELSKLEYMRDHGDAPVLMVQGPPGTGKSFTTAFAILARIQGAIEAGIPFRVSVSCHTHAAIDVLLSKLVDVQQQLDELIAGHPTIAGQYFHPAITRVPIFRVLPRDLPEESIIPLQRTPSGSFSATSWNRIEREQHCVVGGTPLGLRQLVAGKFKANDLLGHELFQCLIIDEASQMNLPLALIASLALASDGHLIVVGDHRQMPPIIKHDWANERRRTFQEYRTYASLFEMLMEKKPPTIRFSRSFRLHEEMAEFLRREIYSKDGIDFHSRERATLPSQLGLGTFIEAVLSPDYPIVVVVHNEDASQLRNQFEQELIAPVLNALAEVYELDCRSGLGVVVPHRAQRAALQEALPVLSERDDEGLIVRSSVDTVERFQGDERMVIVYSATESDPHYLVSASKFLMDPRRLTVALSRARRKVIVVAARSVFSIFSSDEETFENAQIWKNLLRRQCTGLIWDGDFGGTGVQVWGSRRNEDTLSSDDEVVRAN